MNTNRVYLACKFRANDKRTYTYHHDGDDVAVGDKVKVPSNRSDEGWSAVVVAAIHSEAPAFDTKAILGKVDPIAPAQPDLLAGGAA